MPATIDQNDGIAVLLIRCPDRTGLVAAVSDFIAGNGGNLLDCNQHVDRDAGLFYMRVEWSLGGFQIPGPEIDGYFTNLIARRYGMEFQLFFPGPKLRLGLMASSHHHCLLDILTRVQSGEWDVEIPLIISNHEGTGAVARRFDIPFHHIPVSKDGKRAAEQRQAGLLQDAGVDLVVLARYMQILTDDFVAGWQGRMINIHHSFLPAFPGGRPYHQASQRGVKIIGATSHYVTGDLDEGPIIEQDVVRVSHRDSVRDMIRKGRDLEKVVLARAIWLHMNHRVLISGNRTITF